MKQNGLVPDALPCKVALVVASIPPAYAGGGVRFYAYAQRLASRGQLAFLLTHSSAEESFHDFRPQLAEQMIVRLPPERNIGQGIGRIICKLCWMFSTFARVGWLLLRRRRQCDVVHVTGAGWSCLAAIFWAKVVGRPGIIEISLFEEDDPVTIRSNSGRLRYWLWSQARAYVALSPQLRDTCRQSGIPEDRVYLIGSPADTTRFYPVDAATKCMLRKQLSLPEKAPIIIFVGSIFRRKGADLLPAIFRGVLGGVPTAYLLLVGKNDWPPDTGCTEMIRSELKDCLASGQLIFTGAVSNVQEYLQASDLFLFPSRREGLPHAPIEAMACGLPCVAHDIPDLTSFYIKDGVDGVIIRDENPAAYAGAIVRLLSNESEYREMSVQARKKVMTSFSAEVIDGQYGEMYQELRSSCSGSIRHA